MLNSLPKLMFQPSDVKTKPLAMCCLLMRKKMTLNFAVEKNSTQELKRTKHLASEQAGAMERVEKQ